MDSPHAHPEPQIAHSETPASGQGAQPSRVRSLTPCVVCAWVLCALVLTQRPALAAPEDAQTSGVDPLAALLVEKGLLPAAAQGVVRQVRDRTSDLVISAMNFLGVPYRRGGMSNEGFDCSGFTRHVFEMSIGLVLPHRADEQARSAGLMPVRTEDLKPGDLVFFNTMRRTFSHVGIYIGDNKFIHSPRAGQAVRIDDMRYAYWAQRYTGARRANMPGSFSPGELVKMLPGGRAIDAPELQ